MFEISRSGFAILGLQIHWYGILIVLGVLGAVLLACAREKKLGLAKDTSLNLALLLVPVGILCARLYYAAFSWEEFAGQPLKILNLRSGGLAVYGGVIGGALAALVYARVKKLSIGSIADLVAPGLAFGQALGRWGNFFNQEAYGAAVMKPALQFFPVSVYIEGSGWHYATFFYESLWCALICVLLLLAENRGWMKRRGDLFLAYLFLYCLERSIVEGLRTDSLYIGPFRVSQLLSLALMLAVLIVLVLRLREKRMFAALPLLMLMLLGVGLACGKPWFIIIAAVILLIAAAVLYKLTPNRHENEGWNK